MAMEKRDERVNQATSEALSRERKQEAESLQTVRKAEAAALDKVRRAEAARDAVTARVRARKALAWDQEWDLLRGAVLEIWNDAPATNVTERHYGNAGPNAVARQAC